MGFGRGYWRVQIRSRSASDRSAPGNDTERFAFRGRKTGRRPPGGDAVKVANRTKGFSRSANAHGAVIQIRCKVKSRNMDGNNRWYKLAHRDGWFTAR
jgi:hypothetical protein